MKLKLYIVFVLTILFFPGIIFGQKKDTLAILQIYHQSLVKVDSLEFELRLIRKSDVWDKYVNGTFEIGTTDSAFIIRPDLLNIELVQNSSELNLETVIGNNLPVQGYMITPNIINGRFSITVAGPESYNNCKAAIKDSFIVLGKFLVTPKDPMNPAKLGESLTWLKPYFYYQACAYKTNTEIYYDSTNVVRYQPDDNVEMFDGNKIVDYVTENKPEPEMKLDYFKALYAGLKKVKCIWATLSEANNKGFILKRALMGLNIKDTTNEVDWVEIARWNGTRPEEQSLIGLGTREPGKAYEYTFDTVKYRGADYCYRLYYQDFKDSVHYLAQSCLPIPNSVITYAQPNPNPFNTKTTIKFTVDDDVYLTATVYDLSGKEIEKLYNREYVRYGTYDKDFVPSSLASQGLYEIIFIAYPVDDPSIEISRAVVKTQLIR